MESGIRSESVKSFFEVHKVSGMLLTEYNETEQMQLFKEDGER